MVNFKMKTYLIAILLLFVSHAFAAEGVVTSILKPITTVTPKYPRSSAIAGIEGYVELEFLVNEKGFVESAKVTKSEPVRLFDQAAIDAIMQFKFSPHMIDHKAVKVLTTQTIYFKLAKPDA